MEQSESSNRYRILTTSYEVGRKPVLNGNLETRDKTWCVKSLILKLKGEE